MAVANEQRRGRSVMPLLKQPPHRPAQPFLPCLCIYSSSRVHGAVRSEVHHHNVPSAMLHVPDLSLWRLLRACDHGRRIYAKSGGSAIARRPCPTPSRSVASSFQIRTAAAPSCPRYPLTPYNTRNILWRREAAYTIILIMSTAAGVDVRHSPRARVGKPLPGTHGA